MGATGSVGTSTLDLVRRDPTGWRVVALSANCSAGELAALITSRASVLSIYKFAAKALSGRFRSLLPGIGAATNVAANLKTMEAILETAVTAYHRRMLLRDSLAQD